MRRQVAEMCPIPRRSNFSKIAKTKESGNASNKLLMLESSGASMGNLAAFTLNIFHFFKQKFDDFFLKFFLSKRRRIICSEETILLQILHKYTLYTSRQEFAQNIFFILSTLKRTKFKMKNV